MTGYTQPGTLVVAADHDPEGDRCESSHPHELNGASFIDAVTYHCTRPEGHEGPHETRGRWLTIARWLNESKMERPGQLRRRGINGKAKR